MAAAEPRFVVTEMEGFLTHGGSRKGGNARPGISCHVIDSLWNRRLVATYRSEDEARNNRIRAFSQVREQAAAHAQRLNEALLPRPLVEPLRNSREAVAYMAWPRSRTRYRSPDAG